MKNKVMSATDAVDRFVSDGDHLIIGNYTVCTCAEIIYEIVRQRKKGFTLYSQSGIFDVEVLVASGAVERLVTAYIMRSGGKNGGSAVERALKEKTLELEDYTNFNYNARLMAGMHGFPFMQVLEGIMATDIYTKRGFMGEDKFRTIECPYTGKEVLTVPAANPDVCILHVQRADKYGNAQYWGAMGSVAAAALASKKIIISCEEIVEPEVIQSSPHHTIVPAFRTSAVVEIPWGAHPTEVIGHYNLDRLFYGMFQQAAATAEGMKLWMDQWVYGCRNREGYIKKYIETFTEKGLNRLKARPYYSTPANYGSAFTSPWNEQGQEQYMGITPDEVTKIMDERGLYHG